MRGPKTPTEAERELHNLTHTPAVEWCEYCVMGQAADLPHRKIFEDRPLGHPLVQMDHAFTAVVSEIPDEDGLLSKTLIMVDRDTNDNFAITVGSDMEMAYSAKMACALLQTLGHTTTEIRVDNHNEMIALQKMIGVMRTKQNPNARIIPSLGKLRDSKSMGGVEVHIRWWRAKFKALRFCCQDKYGIHIGPKHPLWAWMVIQASFLNTRFRVWPDGQTAFFAIFGHAYTGAIVPFAETVLARMPMSLTRQTSRPGGQRHHKGDSTWVKRIWLGKSRSSDEHIIWTPQGRLRTRTVRRLEPALRFNRNLMAAFDNAPWVDREVDSVRPQRLPPGAHVPVSAPEAQPDQGEVPGGAVSEPADAEMDAADVPALGTPPSPPAAAPRPPGSSSDLPSPLGPPRAEGPRSSEGA